MKKVFWLFLSAFAIRLIALNQSLWLDEAITAVSVRRFSFIGLLTQYAPQDFHPPFYYWLIKFWVLFFGNSEVALRFPSLLLSLATGFLLFDLAGWLAAALFLFNPLVVFYSQEARMYMLATFFLTLSFWAIKKNRPGLFILGLVLAFYTFYGSIFLIAAYLFYLWQGGKKHWIGQTLVILLLALAPLSPLLVRQWQNAQAMTQFVVNWRSVLGTASLKNLLLIPLKFSVGRISFEPKALYYLLAGLWTAFVFSRLNFRQKEIWLLVIPVGLGLGFSLFSPLLSYFRFLYLLPFMALLLAKGLKKSWLGYGLLAVFILLSLCQQLLPGVRREDWRGLSRALPSRATVYGIVSSLEGVNYYRPEVNRLDLRSGEFGAKQLLVVPYTSEVYGLDYQAQLAAQGYRLWSKRSFHQLVLETWRH